MFFRSALGAVLLAVPLTAAGGQSASTEQHPSTASAADSSSGHRYAWLAGAGLTSAAVFTTFVRLSDRGAAANAERELTLPNSPTPNHYTDGNLPGSGVSPGQNAPPPGPPTTDTTKGTGTVGGNQPPDVVNDPKTNDQPDPPNDWTNVGNDYGTPSNDYPPKEQTPPTPPKDFAVVVTTPEPDSIALLGTGLFALLPAVRLRRRTVLAS